MRWPFRRRPDAASPAPPQPPAPAGPAAAGRRAWELLPPLTPVVRPATTIVPVGQPQVSGTRSLVHRPATAPAEVPPGRVEGLAEALPALDFTPPPGAIPAADFTTGASTGDPAPAGAGSRRVPVVAEPTRAAPLTVATEEYVGEAREPAEPYRAPAWLRALSGAPVMDPLLGMVPSAPAPQATGQHATAPRPAAQPLRPAPVTRARRPRGRVGLGAPLTPDETEPEPARVDTAPYALTRELAATYGADLDAVPVHRGGDVDRRAEDLQASAFTAGGAVHLPSTAGTLDSAESRALLAHELIHVAQQRHLAALPDESTPDGADLEAQAVAVENAVRAGAPLPRLDHPAPRVPPPAAPPPAEPPPVVVAARYERREPPLGLRPAAPPPVLHHPAPPRSTGAPPPGGPKPSHTVSTPPPRTFPSPVAPPSVAPSVVAPSGAAPSVGAPFGVATSGPVAVVRPRGGTGTAPRTAGIARDPGATVGVPPASWAEAPAVLPFATGVRTVAAGAVQRRPTLAHPRPPVPAASAQPPVAEAAAIPADAAIVSDTAVSSTPGRTEYHEGTDGAPRNWSEFGDRLTDTATETIFDSWGFENPSGPAGSRPGTATRGGVGAGSTQASAEARFDELYAIRLQATNEAREAAGQPLLDSLTVEEQQRIWDQAGGTGSLPAGTQHEIRNWGDFRDALVNDFVDGFAAPFGIDGGALLDEEPAVTAGATAGGGGPTAGGATAGGATDGGAAGVGGAAATDERPRSETGRLMVDNDDIDVDDLALRLYDRIRSKLRLELLLDRERAGLLSDFR